MDETEMVALHHAAFYERGGGVEIDATALVDACYMIAFGLSGKHGADSSYAPSMRTRKASAGGKKENHAHSIGQRRSMPTARTWKQEK
ncbi:hypothetical protein ACFU5Z_04680 [Streptomyces sp. NPDC057521]|uniref:hypothetical protein n=1 Tax=Streptomyces sp. NPDC057521 TaxID=3346156 RepID=UPI0036C0EBBF